MKTAVVFPGQGSQSIGMADSILSVSDSARKLFEQGSDLLGYDLTALIANDADEQLNLTQYTQPALLATEYVLWRHWQDGETNTPDFLAGHSLGEYVALLCAGVLSFEDAIRLVARRGQLMQLAVPAGTGAMAAIIGADDATVQAVCNELSTESACVQPANYNSHGQVVIAGHTDAVQKAMQALKGAGAKITKQLAVSVPSHSPLLKDAAEQFADDLKATLFNLPQIPVIQNADVMMHHDPDAIRGSLAKQMYSPVRWVETINLLAETGVDALIECGPGKVLSGLIKRINKQLNCQQLCDADSIATFKGAVNV